MARQNAGALIQLGGAPFRRNWVGCSTCRSSTQPDGTLPQCDTHELGENSVACGPEGRVGGAPSRAGLRCRANNRLGLTSTCDTRCVWSWRGSNLWPRSFDQTMTRAPLPRTRECLQTRGDLCGGCHGTEALHWRLGFFYV